MALIDSCMRCRDPRLLSIFKATAQLWKFRVDYFWEKSGQLGKNWTTFCQQGGDWSLTVFNPPESLSKEFCNPCLNWKLLWTFDEFHYFWSKGLSCLAKAISKLANIQISQLQCWKAIAFEWCNKHECEQRSSKKGRQSKVCKSVPSTWHLARMSLELQKVKKRSSFTSL